MVKGVAMTLSEVEAEIAAYYRWFARQAPGVTPKEVGRLAQLWRIADGLYAKEVRDGR